MKNNDYSIYKIIDDKSPRQLSSFDKGDNDLEIDINEIFLEENKIQSFSFKKTSRAVFELYYINKLGCVGTYGLMPTKDNDIITNRKYEDLKQTDKTTASVVSSLFFIDFSKKILVVQNLSDVKAVNINFKKLFDRKKLTLKSIVKKDWEKHLLNKVSDFKKLEISYINHKKSDDYIPNDSDWINMKEYLVFDKITFNIKAKVENFVNALENINLQDFDLFKLTAKEGDKDIVYDVLEKAIKARIALNIPYNANKIKKFDQSALLELLDGVIKEIAKLNIVDDYFLME